MKKTLLMIAVAVSLAACGPQPVPVVQQAAPAVVAPAPVQPQVVVVQQPAVAHNGAGDALAGFAAGALVGHLATRPASPSYHPAPAPVVNRTIVNKTVIVKNYSAPSAPRLSLSKSRR